MVSRTMTNYNKHLRTAYGSLVTVSFTVCIYACVCVYLSRVHLAGLPGRLVLFWWDISCWK